MLEISSWNAALPCAQAFPHLASKKILINDQLRLKLTVEIRYFSQSSRLTKGY